MRLAQYSVFCLLLWWLILAFTTWFNWGGSVQQSVRVFDVHHLKRNHLQNHIYRRLLTPWTLNQTDRNHWSYILDHGSLYSFPTYNQSLQLLDFLIEKYPQYVTKFQAGITVQNRPLYAYSIKKRKTAVKDIINIYDDINHQCLTIDQSKLFNLNNDYIRTILHPTNRSLSMLPQTLLTGLHHAREPASVTAVIFFVGQLLELGTQSRLTKDASESLLEIANSPLTKQSSGSSQTALSNDSPYALATAALCRYVLEQREIVIVPFVNPDGYVAIEHTGNKQIRKNQRITCPDKIHQTELQGIDLNRNYNYSFESTHSPCDEQEYEGTSAFSEPETQAIKCLVDSYDFKMALNFHTFGGVWTRPFNCCNESRLPEVVQSVYDEIKGSIDVIDFDSAPRIGILNYNTTGEADDWMLGRKGIISMSPEIGDERYGFWPPGNAITKINQQAFWHIIEVVMKTGPEISARLQRIDDGDNNIIELQLINHGLSYSNPNSKLALFYSWNSTDKTKQSTHLSQYMNQTNISIWREIESSTLLPFLPFPWSARQQNRFLQSSNLPSPILIESLSSIAPRSTSSNFHANIKNRTQSSMLSMTLCMMETTCCRCSSIPFPRKSLLTPLMITDLDDALCLHTRRLIVAYPDTTSSVHSEVPNTDHQIVTGDMPQSHTNSANAMTSDSSMIHQANENNREKTNVLKDTFDNSSLINDENFSLSKIEQFNASDVLGQRNANKDAVLFLKSVSLSSTNDRILISSFIIAEVAASAAFFILYCLIVSDDLEESQTFFGRIASSFSISFTSLLCCFPCCLRLHHRLRSRTTQNVLKSWDSRRKTSFGIDTNTERIVRKRDRTGLNDEDGDFSSLSNSQSIVGEMGNTETDDPFELLKVKDDYDQPIGHWRNKDVPNKDVSSKYRSHFSNNNPSSLFLPNRRLSEDFVSVQDDDDCQMMMIYSSNEFSSEIVSTSVGTSTIYSPLSSNPQSK